MDVPESIHGFNDTMLATSTGLVVGEAGAKPAWLGQWYREFLDLLPGGGSGVLTAKAASQALLLSAAIYLSHRAWSVLSARVYDACTVTLHLDSRDEAYRWFMEWLSTQPYAATASNVRSEEH